MDKRWVRSLVAALAAVVLVRGRRPRAGARGVAEAAAGRPGRDGPGQRPGPAQRAAGARGAVPAGRQPLLPDGRERPRHRADPLLRAGEAGRRRRVGTATPAPRIASALAETLFLQPPARLGAPSEAGRRRRPPRRSHAPVSSPSARPPTSSRSSSRCSCRPRAPSTWTTQRPRSLSAPLTADDQWIKAARERGASFTLKPASPLLGALRPVKSADEIAALKIAAEITAAAQREAMRSAEPGMFEYQLAVGHRARLPRQRRPGPGVLHHRRLGPELVHPPLEHQLAEDRTGRRRGHGHRRPVRHVHGRHHPDDPDQRHASRSGSATSTRSSSGRTRRRSR